MLSMVLMKKCPNCNNSYPDPFQYCPVDGVQLEPDHDEPARVPERGEYELPPGEASVSVRTLVLSLGILVMAGVLAFTAFFFYQYLRPKYGSLVVKTTPPGATVFVNGEQRGISPLTLSDLRADGYQVKVTKEGYREVAQGVQVAAYSTESLHLTLEPLVAQLTNEQLAMIEDWRKKLDSALKENILLPPPDDYNLLYFANKILEVDPANAYALEAKSKLADEIRRAADVAYAREDWLEAEKQYKNLALIFPGDTSINERLSELAARVEASSKDREKQLQEWREKAEAALKDGTLVPPEKDNALEALRNIQRLDKRSAYARGGMLRLKETLQNRGDNKVASGDWRGARNDFRTVLQYFPEDVYAKARLAMIEAKLQELTQTEMQLAQKAQQDEQQARQRVANLRQSALSSYRSGAYQRAVSEWQEYLKYEPESDEAYFYIGACYLEQKQLDTAILNYEKALALNPKHVLAHVTLGILYDQHRNDMGRAEEHLRRAKELGGIEKYTPERLQAMIQDLQKRLQLESLQKTPFPVEHKHVFSSCRGTLRVLDRGIEFRTSETDHSFFEEYGNLRTFSIVGDELTVRTQNNKKYNFRFLNSGDGDIARRLAARHTSVAD
ncbi:MAG: PEGA domain-containing protein [Acidobacteria bacterium]|nr:PEGA domain-containing protein [Acidobacteriota bacterium]